MRDAGENRVGPGHNSGVARATVVVRLPGVLVDLFPGAVRRLEVEAATVSDMIEALEARWPGMRDRLCDSTPAVRRHINIFVEGERAKLETPLPPGTEVFVLTAISGG
jgi:molybdopterin converting factor small subunit